MTISQFFDAYPWIKVTTFARAMGVDAGQLSRYRYETSEPEEWFLEKFQEYIKTISQKFIEKPITL